MTKKELLIILVLAVLVVLAGYAGYQFLTVPTFTSAELLAEKDVWVRKRVKVGGTAMPSDEVGCTERACPPENPCCNDCGAALTLDRLLVVLDREPTKAYCSGNECSLTCYPLQNGKMYIVKGIWRKKGDSPEHYGYPDYWLELENFSEIGD